MGEEIICLVLLFVFMVAALVCLWNEEYIASLSSFLLGIIMFVILCFTVQNNKQDNTDNNNVLSGVIYDVTDFQVDTNIVVTEADTIKTYTITYYN